LAANITVLILRIKNVFSSVAEGKHMHLKITSKHAYSVVVNNSNKLYKEYYRHKIMSLSPFLSVK